MYILCMLNMHLYNYYTTVYYVTLLLSIPIRDEWNLCHVEHFRGPVSSEIQVSPASHSAEGAHRGIIEVWGEAGWPHMLRQPDWMHKFQ